MKFMTGAEELLEAVLSAQKAVAVRSSMPKLEGILLQAESGKLRLVGYDLEIGIEAEIPADVTVPGSVVIDSRMLGDIVRKLPDPLVRFETSAAAEQQTMEIRSGKAFFRVSYITGDDYPVLPEVPREDKLILPQGVLLTLIRSTIFASSTDESRPNLNGCLLVSTADQLEMVAIDGFRLALYRHQRDTEDEASEPYAERRFLIPGKALRELQQILSERGDVEIYTSDNHILFDLGDAQLVSRLAQTEFLDYKGIIPTSEQTLIRIGTRELLNAIERSLLLLSGEQNKYPVSFSSAGNDVLNVDMQTVRGTLHEEVAIELTGDEIACNFNPRYLVDALRVIPDEQIALAFKGNIGPCVLRPLEDERFSYIVLPLRS